MPRYDRTMKRLTTLFTDDYVHLVFGAPAAHAEPLAIEELDKELPALSREVDFVARVARDGQEALLLIEFQTAWTAEMPQRMSAYCCRLYERYREPVYPVVVVLRPGRRLQREWRMHAWGRAVASCRFQVIALWEMDAAAVIRHQWVGLYPLLPLMRWPQTDPQLVLGHAQDLILDQVHPGEQRADAYVALRVLSGIVYPEALISHIFTRRELMLESPVYQDILEEGHEKGLQRGLQEGREQGLEQGRLEGLRQRLRADVLAVLEVRFGTVPESLPERIESISDLAELETLHRRAVVVEDPQELLRDRG